MLGLDTFEAELLVDRGLIDGLLGAYGLVQIL